MSSDLDLSGTTVTLFGSSDALDHALSNELGRRGCNTHFVSVPMGWLTSATHAVIRLDTRAGAEALEQLAATEQPTSHVIAICPQETEAATRDRLDELCRECGQHHDVSLIWHPPLDAAMPDALASSIADEMADHLQTGPSFVAHPFSS